MSNASEHFIQDAEKKAFDKEHRRKINFNMGKYESAVKLGAYQLLSHAANLGDTRTTVTHPSSTTHSKLTEEDRVSVGILPGLIRVSVGLEHIDDIKQDIEQALQASL